MGVGAGLSWGGSGSENGKERVNTGGFIYEPVFVFVLFLLVNGTVLLGYRNKN